MSWKKKERRNPEKMFSIKFKFPCLNTILRGSVAHCVEDLSFDSVSKFLHPLSSRLLLKNIILEPSSNFLTSALWANFAKVVMDLVSLTHYCSHALVTTSKKVKVNYQDFDHGHHHHLDRLEAWRLLNKLSIAALWHQKFPLAAAAAAHNVLPSQTFVIFHCKYNYYHYYHYYRNHCNRHHIHSSALHDYSHQE